MLLKSVMSTGYHHSVKFNLWSELCSSNSTFTRETKYRNYHFIFTFNKPLKAVDDHKSQSSDIWWSANVIIKPNKQENKDPLYKKRIVSIYVSNNGNTSTPPFKGTLEDYGYWGVSKNLTRLKLLRYYDLLATTKIVIDIHIRFACRCQSDYLQTKILHPQCELHLQKTIPYKKIKNTIPYLWKQQ